MRNGVNRDVSLLSDNIVTTTWGLMNGLASATRRLVNKISPNPNILGLNTKILNRFNASVRMTKLRDISSIEKGLRATMIIPTAGRTTGSTNQDERDEIVLPLTGNNKNVRLRNGLSIYLENLIMRLQMITRIHPKLHTLKHTRGANSVRIN